ncbi:hypothetical protein HYW21_02890 [Candidatus Woesearchaeota archaeon]|nr:hypothetical protein [Candidatus Woesearchaeota archaeon]
MPHQCVRCGSIYEDGSKAILEGCTCGGRFFFFIKKKTSDAADTGAKELPLQLTQEEKEHIEQDVYDLIGNDIDRSKPVVLDLEAIKIVKPGQYELDLVNILKQHPLIYKLEEGKYIIDLPSTFQLMRSKKK